MTEQPAPYTTPPPPDEPQEVPALADPAAERALLGALLINPAMFDEAAGLVRAEDFTVPAHQATWEAIAALVTAGEAVDVASVAARLEAQGRLKGVGGLAFLAGLLADAPSSLAAPTLARTVADYALRRRMQRVAHEALRLAQRRDLTAAEALAEVEAALTAAAEDAARVYGQGMTMAQALDEAKRASQQAAERQKRTGSASVVRWPWPTAARLAMLEPGDLGLLAARPGTGKTTALLHIAIATAWPQWLAARRAIQRGQEPPEPVPGAGVLFVTLEMAPGQVAQRALALLSGVPLSRIRRGRLRERGAQAVRRAEYALAQLPIVFESRPGMTAHDIAAAAMSWARRLDGLGLVVVDYAGLLRSRGSSPYERASRAATELQRAARRIGQHTGAAVLAAIQLSRGPETRADRRPTLADLRDSGRWEEVTDLALALWVDEEPKTATATRTVHLAALKARQDAAGWAIDLQFDPAVMLMTEQAAGDEVPL